MKVIKRLVFSLMILAVMEGCSKPTAPAPAGPASKKVTTPSAPAIPSTVTASMSSSSTMISTHPSVVPKPLASATPAATFSTPLKPGGSSAVLTPNPSLTSTLTTSVPANPVDSPQVYTYNPEGRKDPFMTFLQGINPNKAVKTSIPLLNYSLSDLKLVAVMIIKKHQFLAMVQTPDSKGYVVKPGMEIGVNHGRVHEITDHSLSVEEEYTEIGGEKKKRTIVLSLRPPEEGQL